MIKKVTSFTGHQTAEGTRLTFTYSIIDGNGNLVKSNQRATIIVLDDLVMEAITKIDAFLQGKIPE